MNVVQSHFKWCGYLTWLLKYFVKYLSIFMSICLSSSGLVVDSLIFDILVEKDVFKEILEREYWGENICCDYAFHNAVFSVIKVEKNPISTHLAFPLQNFCHSTWKCSEKSHSAVINILIKPFSFVQAGCFLVDHGDIESVPLDDLRVLDPAFYELAFQV